MRKLLVLVILGLALSINGAEPVQSADATSAWNQYAQLYSFSDYPGALQYSTFDSAYSGNDFNADSRASSALSRTLWARLRLRGGGGEPFGYVQNWPDS